MVAASVRLTPVAPAVQPTPHELTPEQTRTAFVDPGFAVDELIEWTWTSSPHAGFRVRDTVSDRLHGVVIYHDAVTALAEEPKRRVALVAGYGQTVWRDNVALVASSERALALRDAAVLQCDEGTCVDTSVLLASDTVDIDFLAACSAPSASTSDSSPRPLKEFSNDDDARVDTALAAAHQVVR
jgi:hypothetical protein